MSQRNIDELLNMTEYLSLMRLKLIGGLYFPYLSWGLYSLISGILSYLGYYEWWAYLWLPAAFFGSLRPDFKNLKTSIYSWTITGIIYYLTLILWGFKGFIIVIAVASTLGYGVLPSLLEKRRVENKSYLAESMGASFFVIVLSYVALIFVYRTWTVSPLFAYHFTMMVGVFYGINAAFSRTRILWFWSLLLILGAAVGGYLRWTWYFPVALLSISGIYVGIYGYLLHKKSKWEVMEHA